jgi:hypothetical protein
MSGPEAEIWGGKRRGGSFGQDVEKAGEGEGMGKAGADLIVVFTRRRRWRDGWTVAHRGVG